LGVAGELELPSLRLAQADKKIAAIPLMISLEKLLVSDVELFKSEMSFALLDKV
jgi:hypothetical protein